MNTGGMDKLSGSAGGPIVPILSQSTGNFESLYELGNELGRGAFSVVYRCTRRADGQEFAAKVINLKPLRMRENFNPKRMKREVEIMRQMRHEHIIQLEDAFETVDNLYLVMELCPGRELFDIILERRKFTECDARNVFQQICKAVHYLHSHNIIHRDIKPENVLCAINEADNIFTVKLLDFGLSKNINETTGGSLARTFVGTPSYLAPEVEWIGRRSTGNSSTPPSSSESYGTPADCWSLGALLYVMLVARFPEYKKVQVSITSPSTDKNPIPRKTTRTSISVNLQTEVAKLLSSEAKDLIGCLMNGDAFLRLSIERILTHRWFGPMSEYILPPIPMNDVDYRLGFIELQRNTISKQKSYIDGSYVDLKGNNVILTDDDDGGGGGEYYKGYDVTDDDGDDDEQQQEHDDNKATSPASETSTSTTVTGNMTIVNNDSIDGHSTQPNSAHSVGTNNYHNSDEDHHHHQQDDGNRNQSILSHGMESLKISPMGQDISIDTSSSSSSSNSAHNSKLVQWKNYTLASPNEGSMSPQYTVADSLNILIISKLQQTVTSALASARSGFASIPLAAASIREAAVLCRTQMHETRHLMMKVHETATSVLRIIDDVVLAVEEGESELALSFLRTMADWTNDLLILVKSAQDTNKNIVGKIQAVVVSCAAHLSSSSSSLPSAPPRYLITNMNDETDNDNNSIAVPKQLYDAVEKIQTRMSHQNGELTADDFMEVLFCPMDAVVRKRRALDVSLEGITIHQVDSKDDDEDDGGQHGVNDDNSRRVEVEPNAVVTQYNASSSMTSLMHALACVQELDKYLDGLAQFWMNTEVALGMLMRDGDHVQKFVQFASSSATSSARSTSRLGERFRHRMQDYKSFWERVQAMSGRCVQTSVATSL